MININSNFGFQIKKETAMDNITNKKTKRVLYFDVLNILAALSVIFLHCNGNSFTYTGDLAWYQALLVEVVCYWAVPIFLMLSGANLMNYRDKYTTKEFFKKRFMKTLIPFVIWSLIVAVMKEINPFETGWRTFINDFFGCKIESVYWFFIPLFAVYLSMPVISCLKDNRKVLWYMAGGTFVLGSLLPQVFAYLGLAWNYNLSMQTVSGWLIFPIIGYLFATTDFTKIQRIIIYVLALFSATLRYFGTVLLTRESGVLNKTFYGDIAYFSVMLACGVFVFFKYNNIIKKLENNDKISKIISKISSCSFGVYLMHMLIFRFLGRYIEVYHWQWRLLVPFVIYFIALITTYILKKIPVLKYIVP